MQSKIALRAHMRKLRKQCMLPIEQEQALINHFEALLTNNTAQTIALYAACGAEISAEPLFKTILQKSHQACFPCIGEDTKHLTFKSCTKLSDLKPNSMNIAEPINGTPCLPDIIIAPLLAFDKHGNRLGQGGGYYDTTLEALRKVKPVQFIGLAYVQQEWQDEIPSEPHDIKLDGILTPEGLNYFT